MSMNLRSLAQRSAKVEESEDLWLHASRLVIKIVENEQTAGSQVCKAGALASWANPPAYESDYEQMQVICTNFCRFQL
jgi:hypothetical protein